MKFFIAVLLTATLSFIASLWFDWWIIAVAAFLVALLVPQKAWKTFLCGFLGIFLLWGILAQWTDAANDSLLSASIATLLGIGDNSLLLVLISAFVGALVAGFAAMTGSFLRSDKS